jgi:hypothetical protein
MEQSLDLQKLRIDLHKAAALKEFRPYLNAKGAKRLARSRLTPHAMRYFSRIVYAHVEALLESYPLAADIDIEALTDRALKEATDQANSPVVDEIAVAARIYLVDAARVTYLRALDSRTRHASPSRFGSLDHDPEYEQWSREACEGFLHQAPTQVPGSGPNRAAKGSRKKPLQQQRRNTRQEVRNRKIASDNVKHLRAAHHQMLAEYKKETGVKSDRSIYGCAGKPGTHSCHKPQFIQWKNGRLSPKSQPYRSLETFLKERRLPPRAPQRERKNLPHLPPSTN